MIFAAVQIDGCLAAHGGIHHGQQRSGDLNKAHAPEIGRGGKARQIARHAAAQRNDQVAAGEAPAAQGVEQRTVGGKAFLLFSVGKNETLHSKASFPQGSLRLRAIKGKDPVVRHQHGGAWPHALGRKSPQPGQKPPLHQDLIAAGGGNVNADQWPSTSSFRRRPSSRSRASSALSCRSSAA